MYINEIKDMINLMNENSLTELSLVEETRLIPRIIEAQKKINATDH